MSRLTHVALGMEVSQWAGWGSGKHLFGFLVSQFSLFIYLGCFPARQDAHLLLQLGGLSANLMFVMSLLGIY